MFTRPNRLKAKLARRAIPRPDVSASAAPAAATSHHLDGLPHARVALPAAPAPLGPKTSQQHPRDIAQRYCGAAADPVAPPAAKKRRRDPVDADSLVQHTLAIGAYPDEKARFEAREADLPPDPPSDGSETTEALRDRLSYAEKQLDAERALSKRLFAFCNSFAFVLDDRNRKLASARASLARYKDKTRQLKASQASGDQEAADELSRLEAEAEELERYYQGETERLAAELKETKAKHAAAQEQVGELQTQLQVATSLLGGLSSQVIASWQSLGGVSMAP